MKIVFCGTPQFAVPTLKFLLTHEEFEIAAVVTQPDRPSGRGMKLTTSPVKEAAVAAGVPVHQPEKIRAPEMQTTLEAIAPDCIVIIAYGQIIPGRLLPIARYGWINLHASLLPKYRGAAPINWAIVNGETVSGITTMRIDAGMDTGEMLLQHEMAISANEMAPELATRRTRMARAESVWMISAQSAAEASGVLTRDQRRPRGLSAAGRISERDSRMMSSVARIASILGSPQWGSSSSKRGGVTMEFLLVLSTQMSAD